MLSNRDLVLCELLVLRCRKRDSQAAFQLTSLFQRPLLYYLRRLVDSEHDAWDLLQETWFSVFRSLDDLQDGRALPAFLYRVAHNKAMAYHRKRKAAEKALSSLASGDAHDPAIEPDVEFTTEDAAEVHAGLQQLSLPHREVLTLFFFQELSIKDIAIILEVPVGTVKSRLRYAKVSLRGLLKKGANHDISRI